MSKFKNMKIQVENNLDEIVMELEAKGYTGKLFEDEIDAVQIVTFKDGVYTNIDYESKDMDYILTTIAELKEM